MATKLKKVAIGLFIYLITIGSTCKKPFECVKVEYSFSTTAKAYQYIDSININDTIWIDFDQSTIFQDTRSGLDINFNNAINLGFGLTFDKFIGGSISNPGTQPAVSDFSVVVVKGTELQSLQPNRIKSFNFLQETDRYRLRVYVLARASGIFSITISNAANVYRANDDCSTAGFSITFANTNQHLYFYEQNRPGYTPSQYERTHMYCFKVK